MAKKENSKESLETDVKLYSQLARKDPERDLTVPEEEEETKALALSEQWNAADLSDMQSAIANLFPSGLGDSISNKVMIARIAPEVFISALRLMTVEDIMQSDPDKPINVVATMMKNYILLSVGLDGKGRIDHIELAGASREAEDLEKLGKGLF